MSGGEPEHCGKGRAKEEGGQQDDPRCGDEEARGHREQFPMGDVKGERRGFDLQSRQPIASKREREQRAHSCRGDEETEVAPWIT
jgi:hypothetical protein